MISRWFGMVQNLGIEKTTLVSAVARLETMDMEDIDYILYAARIEGQWTKDSPCVLVEDPNYVADDYKSPPAPEGMEYFLEASIALEAIEAFEELSGNVSPSLEEKLKVVIYYAEHDAYYPVE